MKIKLSAISGIIAACCLWQVIVSCSEIFADDLTGYTVKLSSPADGTSTPDTVLTLHWVRLEAEAEYQVQVAQPRFDTIASMLKDTVTSGVSLRVHSLVRGKNIQWRVRAIGASFVSPYSKPWTIHIQN